MEVAMATDPTSIDISLKSLLNYGVAGAVLGYYIYVDYKQRQRQAARDKSEDDRRIEKDKAEEARNAARALADQKEGSDRERDCVEQIRKSEAARTTELKEYLFKHMELQLQSNSLYERLIKFLEEKDQETKAYRKKEHHNEG